MDLIEERNEARRLIAVRQASGQEVWLAYLPSALQAYEEARYQEVLRLLDISKMTKALQEQGR